MSRYSLSRRSSRGFIRTYFWMILSLTALTIVAAVAVTLSKPIEYVATSQVLVSADPARTNSNGQPDMGTERALASSGVVTNAAAARLNISPGAALTGLSVSVPVDANVLNFAYSAPTAVQARTRVAAFTSAYVNFRNAGRKVKLAEVITQPVTPDLPNKPNLPVVIGLGLVLGALIGIGFAFVWDKVRGRLRDEGDVVRQTGLPVLTSVPRAAQSLPLRRETGPPGPLSEVFGYLAAQVSTLPDRGRGSCLVLTSPSRRAGTTTVAAGLAIALAGTGKDVVLIGGDLRHPTVHTLFGAAVSPGLTDVLADSKALTRSLVATEFEGLRLLPGGAVPVGGRPSFNVEDLDLLIGTLSKRATVVIDTAAVTQASETALLAGRSDFVLLVVDARRGRRADAAAAVEALKSAGGNPVGCVLNAPVRSSAIVRGLSGLPGVAKPERAPAAAQPVEADQPAEQAGPDGREELEGSERAGK